MEAEEYRKMAEVEDRMWYYRALHRHVTRSVDSVLRNKKVRPELLDAGCGTGGLLRTLKRACPNATCVGLDFSPLACELAKTRTGLAVVEGSILALPFSPAQFDVITSCDVVCQVPDAPGALRELYRCLKPGGQLVITMPAYQWLYSYHDRQVANLRRYARGELSQLLSAAGFKIVRSTYWNTLPFPLAVMKRKFLSAPSATSDVQAFPGPVEAFFNGLMAIEQAWLSLGGRLPFGTSILTVAEKPSHHDAAP